MQQRLLTLALLLVAASAQAQLEHPTVRQAREQIVPYGPNTLAAIAGLRETVESADRRFDQLDARYLRAIAATDLLLLHHLGEGGATPAQVAEALGVREDNVTVHLHEELTEIAYGQYFDESMDALRAIEVIEGGRPSSWTGRSSRRDVLDVLDLIRRADGPVADLAATGSDPCARGRCEQPWSYFDEEGRKAIHSLRTAYEMLGRLETRVRAGDDPLAVAIGERLPQIRERLESVRLAPTANWGFVLQTPTVVPEAHGEPSRAAAVLHVDTDRVRYVPAPRVRLQDGEPVLVAESREMPLPTNRRAFITAIPEVVAWLREEEPAGSVALSSHPEVEALTMWQVIASAERAGTTLRRLAVVDGHGRLHTRPFRVEDSAPSSEAQVFVRLGGYSVRMGTRSVRLPRTHTGNGWVHDRQGLRQAVGSHDRVAYRTMGVAPVSLLFDAVFTPDTRSATLVRR